MEGPRGALKDEIGGVLDLANAVFRSQERSMGEEFPLLYHESNAENLRIILEGGKPVSLVGVIEGEVVFFGHALRVGCIGSVSTYEEYRNRGYAGMLLRDAMKKMFRDGIDYMLVSGGRGLYLRHGCAPAGCFYKYRIPKEKVETIGSTLRRAFGEALYLREYPGAEAGTELPDAGVLGPIYHGEPLRYRRSNPQFGMLLGPPSRRKRMGGTEKLFLFFHSGLPVAYVMLRISKEKDGTNYAELIEIAGDRLLILLSLSEITAACGVDAFALTISAADTTMRALLGSLGLDGVPATLPGHTFRVINFPSLMRKLMPYFEDQVGKDALEGLAFRSEPTGTPVDIAPDDEEFNRIFAVRHVIEYRGGKVTIEDERCLARLIFGSPGASDADYTQAGPGSLAGSVATLTEDVLNAINASGPLLELLREILPVPVPVPGLDYV